MGPVEKLFLWLVPDDAWKRFEDHPAWTWVEDHALTITVVGLGLIFLAAAAIGW